MSQTKKYRIPAAPIGVPYYRQGTMYEPGQVVLLPADELAPGWRIVNGKPAPKDRHAWKLLEPGVKEKSEEKLSALELARQRRKELEKQLEEESRLEAELEEAAKDEKVDSRPRRGIVEDGDEDQPVAEPKDPEVDDVDEDPEGAAATSDGDPEAPPEGQPAPAKAKGPAKPKGQRKARAQDQGL